MVYPAKCTCYSGSSLTPSLLKIFALQRTCLGAHVKLLSDLPPLRFCTVIEGNLTLAITEPGATEADFHIFKDLEEIRGVFVLNTVAIPIDSLTLVPQQTSSVWTSVAAFAH